MALFKLNSDEALSSHNRHRKWPSNQRFGSETLHPLAQPHFDKKIQIESTDVIATFGSCFAKRVLFAMPKSMDIIRISDGYDCEDLEESRIRYNVFSMLNQLRWGFGLIDDELSYSGIFPTGKDNQFGDYHGHRLFLEDTPASELAVFYKDETAVRHSRMLYNEKFKQIERANVFIFTLGMAEVWYDQETNLHLNMMPPIPMMKKNKTRFEFQQLDYFDRKSVV